MKRRPDDETTLRDREGGRGLIQKMAQEYETTVYGRCVVAGCWVFLGYCSYHFFRYHPSAWLPFGHRVME